MSDNSTAMAIDSPAAVERPSVWRNPLALLAAPFAFLWQSWSAPDNTVALHEISEEALWDMGASPELLAEAQALREFEQSRAHALSVYYW